MRRFHRLACLILALTATATLAQEAAVEVPASPDAATADAALTDEIEAVADTASDTPTDEVEIPAEVPGAEAAEEPASDEAAADEGEADAEPADGIDWAGLTERAPVFFAVFHRAAVHMPIALWTLGAFFVLVGIVVPSWRNQIPLACLIGGMLTGVAAAATGWWNAEHEWADEWAWADLSDPDRFSEAIVQHRWVAVVLVVASVILSILALVSQRKKSKSLGAIWRIGLLALAAGVGWEGHLGGEMTVGEGYVEDAYQEWVNPDE